MTRSAGVAAGLWLILAIVVFQVTFDWDMRLAGKRFSRSQIVRHAQGLPPRTIEAEFRPMVRVAARRSLVWFGLIAGTGAIGITIVQMLRLRGPDVHVRHGETPPEPVRHGEGGDMR